MNNYQQDNVPPSLSDLTTSLGINNNYNQDYYKGGRYITPEEMGQYYIPQHY